ncbi:MAG: sulfatase-like hydrolase/transferase, partial [Planctomycetota bacterium]
MRLLPCCLILAACGIAPTPANTPKQTSRPPSIVYILADDLGYGELGCYGQRKIRTPHVDALARNGMRFTRHYCGAPVCAPSRCVLLTGKHLGHATIRANKPVRPEGQWPIRTDDVTVAEVLRQRGYATACVGKWGLGPVGSTGDPNRHGFDLFYGYICQRVAHSYYPPHLWHNGKRVEINKAPVP